LASSVAFQAFESTGRRATLNQAFDFAFGSRNGLTDRIGEYLQAYCDRIGLDRRGIRGWLMDFFTTKGERMTALYGPRNTYARAWATLGERAATSLPAFVDAE
jgi:hypothetical protein